MCSVTPDTIQTLPSNETAPARARALLRRAACRPHNASVLETAQLLVSEVVTNAVVHGAPPIKVCVGCIEAVGMQVHVSDGSPVMPLRAAPSGVSESGRGIGIVEMLSDDWGVDPARDGKEVWFRLNPQTEP